MPPRPQIIVDPTETLESVLSRSPKENLRTPPAKKAVPLRPLKRVCFAGGIQTDEDDKENVPPSDDDDTNEQDARLSPRKLDLDQPVAGGRQEVVPDSEDDDEEPVRVTQEYVPGPTQQEATVEEEQEEGEIVLIARTPSVAC
jgi:hypothetical protein